MKLAKMMLTASMLLVPALAMGVAQQDPAIPANPAEQQLQQDLQQDTGAQPSMKEDVIGVIAEVREDSFSVRSDADQSVTWFMITPELKSSASSELVTGNHVRVAWADGDMPDRKMASSVMAEPDTRADLDVDIDTDSDLDAEIAVDEDSATATLDSDTEFEDTDTEIAQADTDTSLREDTDTYDADDDSDELPRTASSLPVMATVGLLALLGAAAVAFVRKF